MSSSALTGSMLLPLPALLVKDPIFDSFSAVSATFFNEARISLSLMSILISGSFRLFNLVARLSAFPNALPKCAAILSAASLIAVILVCAVSRLSSVL